MSFLRLESLGLQDFQQHSFQIIYRLVIQLSILQIRQFDVERLCLNLDASEQVLTICRKLLLVRFAFVLSDLRRKSLLCGCIQ